MRSIFLILALCYVVNVGNVVNNILAAAEASANSDVVTG
jgi:hypothetical protein